MTKRKKDENGEEEVFIKLQRHFLLERQRMARLKQQQLSEGIQTGDVEDDKPEAQRKRCV